MIARNFQDGEIRELKQIFGTNISLVEENAETFILIPNIKIPGGVDGQSVDLLFCPNPWGGYSSRLFFSRPIKTTAQLNWNTSNARLVERNWFAFSWRVSEGLRLAETIMAYLEAAK